VLTLLIAAVRAFLHGFALKVITLPDVDRPA
jgi:hypothetical protein